MISLSECPWRFRALGGFYDLHIIYYMGHNIPIIVIKQYSLISTSFLGRFNDKRLITLPKVNMKAFPNGATPVCILVEKTPQLENRPGIPAFQIFESIHDELLMEARKLAI
jgi:hypothetical protein